jgi:GAF domain-containing protein
MDRGTGERDLMARLEAVYASGDAGPLEAAAAVLAARLGALGADAGFVAAVSGDGRTVDVARVTPFSESPVRLAFPADAPYPLAAAIRHGEPLFISSNDTLECDHPGLIRIRGEDHACATLPLHGPSGAVIGSANVSFEEPREFSESDRRQIEGLFVACEEAMARALELRAGPV